MAHGWPLKSYCIGHHVEEESFVGGGGGGGAAGEKGTWLGRGPGREGSGVIPEEGMGPRAPGKTLECLWKRLAGKARGAALGGWREKEEACGSSREHSF